MEYRRPQYVKLESGVGTIQAGPEQQERLDEITERLRGDEFYVNVPETIPSRCIDGRVGTLPAAPNAAGGTETLMVADDLTFKRFAAPTTLESYANVINSLQENGLPVGGHTDEHADDVKSGCGANDKLETIYAFIVKNGDIVRETVSGLGIAVDDETHALILGNAAARTEFSPGSELLTVLRTADPESVDPLRGDHKEVAAVINTKAGTTLDRVKLEEEFGPQYESFNLDAWALPIGVKAIAESEDRIPALVAASGYYNVATALVLCGPDMRLVIR